MHRIVDFQADADWRIVNDGVMGGRSESTFGVEKGRGVFRGNLSPENGGGFASVRTEVRLPPELDVVAVAIRVFGDGKRYQVRIRTDERWDGPAYRHEVSTTKGQWVNVTLPLADFELSFRGRPVPNAPLIDPRRIRQIGLLIAGKQWGPFQLEVEWIRAVTKEAQSLP
jgi:monofunctional biosynthetic peptidoglycan transglycosylase